MTGFFRPYFGDAAAFPDPNNEIEYNCIISDRNHGSELRINWNPLKMYSQ